MWSSIAAVQLNSKCDRQINARVFLFVHGAVDPESHRTYHTFTASRLLQPRHQVLAWSLAMSGILIADSTKSGPSFIYRKESDQESLVEHCCYPFEQQIRPCESQVAGRVFVVRLTNRLGLRCRPSFICKSMEGIVLHLFVSSIAAKAANPTL